MVPGSKSTRTARGTYLPPARQGGAVTAAPGGAEGAGGAPSPTCGLVVVHVDALQLQVAVAVVGTGWVDAMFVADHLPKLRQKIASGAAGPGAPPPLSSPPPPPPAHRPHLGPDLVSALPGLQVHDLPHDGGGTGRCQPTPLFPQPTLTARGNGQALYSSGMRAQPSFPLPGGHSQYLLATHNEALQMRKSVWSERCHSNHWLLFAPPTCQLILLLGNRGPTNARPTGSGHSRLA